MNFFGFTKLMAPIQNLITYFKNASIQFANVMNKIAFQTKVQKTSTSKMRWAEIPNICFVQTVYDWLNYLSMKKNMNETSRMTSNNVRRIIYQQLMTD